MFYRGRLSLHPSVCITPKPELTSKEGIGYTKFGNVEISIRSICHTNNFA